LLLVAEERVVHLAVVLVARVGFWALPLNHLPQRIIQLQLVLVVPQ
jgi:hypothetical protein